MKQNFYPAQPEMGEPWRLVFFPEDKEDARSLTGLHACGVGEISYDNLDNVVHLTITGGEDAKESNEAN